MAEKCIDGVIYSFDNFTYFELLWQLITLVIEIIGTYIKHWKKQVLNE